MFHAVWGWVAIVLDSVAGLYGLGLALFKRDAGRTFKAAVMAAIGASCIQVVVGLILYGTGERPGRFHVFYGVLTALALAGAYVYRSDLSAKRPALRWGLLSLFLAGLGLRAVTTFGR
jgi:hypothetical protein